MTKVAKAVRALKFARVYNVASRRIVSRVDIQQPASVILEPAVTLGPNVAEENVPWTTSVPRGWLAEMLNAKTLALEFAHLVLIAVLYAIPQSASVLVELKAILRLNVDQV